MEEKKEFRKECGLKQINEVIEMCKPILKYLQENCKCGNFLTLIITDEYIKILSEELSIPVCTIEND